MPVDPVAILDTASSRSESAYLAVIVIVFCALILGGIGYVLCKLWKEVRRDHARDSDRMMIAIEAVAITNLSVQQMLSVIHLMRHEDGPTSSAECAEYNRKVDELLKLQEAQRLLLEKKFP